MATSTTILGAESTALPTWPQFDDEQIEAAAAVLKSGKINYWTGTEGRQFEKEFASKVGVKHAVAMANGTVALEAALQALEIEPGAEVVTTSRTFIASASAAVMRGLTPVVADVDRDSGNITAESIERVLTAKTKAIIPVHLGGWPCEMDEIMALARAHGLAVIEDCAQANGATLNGRAIGTFGQINAWSFCQDKIISTAGEGGMVTTDDGELWRRTWSFKDHGKDYDAVYNQKHAPGFRWLHHSFGTNMRLTEVQSAIGRIQLRRLDEWVAKRRLNAETLMERLCEMKPLRVPTPPHHVKVAWYRVYAYVRPETLKPNWTRDRIVAAMEEANMPCFTGSCSEIYREKAFIEAGLGPSSPLPIAKELQETSLAFLVHPTLEPKHMHALADALSRILYEASR